MRCCEVYVGRSDSFTGEARERLQKILGGWAADRHHKIFLPRQFSYHLVAYRIVLGVFTTAASVRID